MKLYLLLLIILFACSESEPIQRDEPTLKGSYQLVKAVGHQLMDVGGPSDRTIIRRVPHTYDYSNDPIGWLVLGEDYFYMDAPIELEPLLITGFYKALEPTTGRLALPQRMKLRYNEWFGHGGARGGLCCPEFPFSWTDDNLLKLTFWISAHIEWELYWVYYPNGIKHF